MKKEAKVFKQFKVVAVSENTNSFGLFGVVLVAKDGKAFQAGHSGFLVPSQGSDVLVEVREDGLNWARAGFEIPEELKSAPTEVVNEVWKK
jgi:hypothetical protein